MDENLNATKPNETAGAGPGPYYFAGRVLPERSHAYFYIPARSARLPDREIRISVFCFGSNFTGSISASEPFDSLLDAATVVSLVLRNVVDRLSFEFLCGYDIEVTSITAVDERHEILGVYEPVFFATSEEQHAFTRQQVPFFSPVEMTPHHPRLDHAFRCFNHAQRDRALTTFFCYLAIETTARMIAELVRKEPILEMDGAAWRVFRETLRIERATIDIRVKTLADQFRHGNFVNTSWAQRKEALSLTWTIIQRSLHFLHDGTTLSPAAFPLL